jgi:hypothetical protein
MDEDQNPDWNTGWDKDGKADQQPTVELCLRRAAVAMQYAWKGKLKNGESAWSDQTKRDRFSNIGNGYANLALALQNEREYRERQIKQIREETQGWIADAAE